MSQSFLFDRFFGFPHYIVSLEAERVAPAAQHADFPCAPSVLVPADVRYKHAGAVAEGDRRKALLDSMLSDYSADFRIKRTCHHWLLIQHL
jgi:hypothetical protein